MNWSSFSGRTVTRLYEGTQAGADYGCSITKYESRRIPLHVWAMVAIGVVGFIVIYLTR